MKKMKKNIVLFTAIALGLMACKPEIKGELGELTNKEVGMDGMWELSKFTIQDPNSPILEQRDFTSFYTGENITPMTMNTMLILKKEEISLVIKAPGSWMML
jgi:hypothetical protein